MLQGLFLALTVGFLGLSASPSCPSGYWLHAENGKCYKHLPTVMTHTQANATCAKENAHLVHIASAAENAYLLSNASGADMWIGLQCNGNSSANCYWEDDGTKASYSNFLRGPDTSAGNCTLMYGNTGKWASYSCDAVYEQVICEQDANKCGDGWTYFNGSCYQIFNNNSAMHNSQAQMLCNSFTAQLASIHGQAENQAVLDLSHTLTKNSDVWIGLRRVGATQKFEWSDGSKWNFENWTPNAPSNRTQYVWGVMHSRVNNNDGYWADSQDDQLNYVVCKKSP